MKQLNENLLDRLTQADVVCSDCGTKYGKYSVGCSSVWEGTCNVCGEVKPITEVRDYGYLTKGIARLKGENYPLSDLTKNLAPGVKESIKKQSKSVADYMLSVGPIMTDGELDEELVSSYEKGEITLKLTEKEVAYLNHCLDVISDAGIEDEDVFLFEEVEKKITELYADYCVKYGLSPALEAYNKKYGTWGTGEDEQRWEGFRDAYNLLNKEQ